MTADPRETVSDFTEMTDSPAFGNLRYFLYAGIAGSFVAALPGLLLAFVTGFDVEMLAPASLLISATIIFTCMVIFCLPLTLYLKRHNRETRRNYVLPALFLGAFIPFVTILALGFDPGLALLLAALDTFAAATAASIWGSWRERLTGMCRPSDPDHPTNPYHDMIY